MSRYFEYFPETTHTQKKLLDITKRVDFSRSTFSDPYAFLPYTVEGDDRPEDVALYYYGSVRHTWIVYLSNNIIDPYYDWPLTYEKFQDYIIKKYQDLSGESGTAVIDWTLNETITENIIYYRNKSDNDFIISKDSYELNPDLIEGEWEAVRYYLYEDDINESKRIINLLDNRYVKKAEDELRVLLNEPTN
jgi:hypothetical protein